MKAIKSKIVKALPNQAKITTCDNSGAKVIKIISVKGHKTVKGRVPSAGIGDMAPSLCSARPIHFPQVR